MGMQNSEGLDSLKHYLYETNGLKSNICYRFSLWLKHSFSIYRAVDVQLIIHPLPPGGFVQLNFIRNLVTTMFYRIFTKICG